MTENLKKKYEAYTGKKINGEFRITPLKVTNKDKVITKFKGFIINAWSGIYELRGNPEVLDFAYRVGVGGRNSQGFGMFKII
ncbi:CRISPR-associated endoribonuclease Cas6 [Tepidibacillus marianensis]|uniref:CRISPR-associated endoribonuclease Cas6 n=1 Tax=Tepidibacillus marianensis TaxID=3131995 RepID=UPI0030D031A7